MYIETEVDTTPVGTRGLVVEDYLHGRCNNFALVLSEITGLPVGGFFSIDLSISEDFYCLDHVYCILDDSYIVDASGIRHIDDVKDAYGFNEDHSDQLFDCFDLVARETRLKRYTSFMRGERLVLRRFIQDKIIDQISAFNTQVLT